MNNEARALGNSSGTNSTARMKPATSKQNSRRDYQKHGQSKRKRNLKRRGIDAIDGRTIEGRDALKFRDDAIADLGGKDISRMKKAIVEVATGERYLWRYGWSFILNDLKGSPINKRKRSFYPVVKDTLAAGESLIKHAKDVGLERVVKLQTLQELLDGPDDDDSPTPEPSRANGNGDTKEDVQ